MEDISDFRKITKSVLMTPQYANFTGRVHGGDILRLLDQVAYACAARYCGRYCVTLSVDSVVFKHPVEIGNLLHFFAQVNFVGRTSMEVGVKVIAENITARSVVHTNSAYFTMVCIGEDGKPAAVPPLDPQTKEDKRRFENAKARRDARIALEKERKSSKKNKQI